MFIQIKVIQYFPFGLFQLLMSISSKSHAGSANKPCEFLSIMEWTYPF